MPEPNRASFAGFDESRTVGLDMDMYRKWLSKATCGFAYLGALESRLIYFRPRGRSRGKVGKRVPMVRSQTTPPSRVGFPGFDESRTIELDMDTYVQGMAQ